jgi:sec-independent protein translocase protein TatA
VRDVGELSPWHWLIVIAVAAVVLGSRRLPDAARSLGRSVRILEAELGAEHPPPAHPTDDDPGSTRPAPS